MDAKPTSEKSQLLGNDKTFTNNPIVFKDNLLFMTFTYKYNLKKNSSRAFTISY